MKPFCFSLIFLLTLIGGLSAQPPANDDFRNARPIPLQGWFETAIKFQFSNAGPDGTLATRSPREPLHAGQRGSGTVWFTWSRPVSRRIEITVRGEKTSPIVAVYTGTDMSDLTLVHRYPLFVSPAYSRAATEPLSSGARVEFLSEQDLKYYIAVSTEEQIADTLSFEVRHSRNNLDPDLLLADSGSEWEYLSVMGKENDPIPPTDVDQDFLQTWHQNDSYDGPQFKKGLTPIGFGSLDFNTLKTEIYSEAELARMSRRDFPLYLKKTFTAEFPTYALGIEGLFDDGAIIYLDGKELGSVNIYRKSDRNNFRLRSLASLAIRQGDEIQNEDRVSYVTIDGLDYQRGDTFTLAILLVNQSEVSPDLGTDLRVYSLRR